MRVVLWDTRRNDVNKDFAGGFGVGMYPGLGGVRGWIVRRFYRRDYRPVAMSFAYLAAILRQHGHTVEYALDRTPPGEVYVFNPALLSLPAELQAMRDVRRQYPQAQILVIGAVAWAMPETFAPLDAKVLRGEPEQLQWKLDEVLQAPAGPVDVGSVRDLNALPFPDWEPFRPERFRVAYDFWKFPTGFIQQSRGCTFTCNYCPYIMVENKTRFRDPESVADELRHGIARWGFRSFKFRDPLFGLDRKRVLRLAELIGKLPRKIQFSIESRIDLLKPETLVELRRVGLVSITVGIETPDEGTLRRYKRAPVRDDKQRQFVQLCRRLGIRTVAGFMIGFPEDTRQSIGGVLRYARKVGPTYANFNVVTPYPGTPFFEEIRDQIASFDYDKYSVYHPVLKYRHLTPDEVQSLHAHCFTRYYFRSRYFAENAHLLWPWLQKLGLGRVTDDLEAIRRDLAAGAGPAQPGEQPPQRETSTGIQLRVISDDAAEDDSAAAA